MRWIFSFAAAFLISGSALAEPKKGPCATERVHGQAYVICRFDLAKAAVTVRWRNKKGKAFGSLRAATRELGAAGKQLLFAMNGGMYHADLSPVGYFVEGKRKLKNANTRRGPGNFHMLPNGIFFVDGKTVGVMETRAFLKRNKRPLFATQSGPMLVVNGKLHPNFRAKSESRKIRNGVGVSANKKTVYFVLSDQAVTFHAFASVFQKHLRTPNALFLDGSVSQMVSKEISRFSLRPVGPIIIARER